MVNASPRHHYLSHVGPLKVFAGKGLWKGPSRLRARGTGRAGVTGVARLGRMGRVRSANGIISHVSTYLYS